MIFDILACFPIPSSINLHNSVHEIRFQFIEIDFICVVLMTHLHYCTNRFLNQNL